AEPLDHLGERAERPCAGPPDAITLLCSQRRLEGRESALGGPAQETTAGLVADPAARVVHDPIERAGVPRVRDEPQIGESVHEIAPLVEACAADDLVRHVSPPQRLLERAR